MRETDIPSKLREVMGSALFPLNEKQKLADLAALEIERLGSLRGAMTTIWRLLWGRGRERGSVAAKPRLTRFKVEARVLTPGEPTYFVYRDLGPGWAWSADFCSRTRKEAEAWIDGIHETERQLST